MTSTLRKSIPAATEAAVWVVSNGLCYFNACGEPVVKEVRPKVYQKNPQVAHIYGVEPKSPRYRLLPKGEDPNSFKFLLLLCYAHHNEVDDKRTGEALYPPEKLLAMKANHEGSNATALTVLGSISEEQLSAILLEIFETPSRRLEKIADQLAATGAASAETLAELKQIVTVLTEQEYGLDRSTVSSLAFAAEIFGDSNISSAASQLAYAAEVLSNLSLDVAAQNLSNTAESIDIGEMNSAAQSLIEAAAYVKDLNLDATARRLITAAEMLGDR